MRLSSRDGQASQYKGLTDQVHEGPTPNPRGILASGAAVKDELQELRNGGYKPVLVGPQPFSLEEILRNVNPAPDEETERFVAGIYADRRQAAEHPPSE